MAYTFAAEKASTADAPIGSDVSLAFPLPDKRGKLTAKFFTTGKATAELKLDNPGVRGLTATLLAGTGGKGGEFATGSADFKHGPAGVHAAYDVQGKKARASAAYAVAPAGYAGFFVLGVDGVVKKNDGEGEQAVIADGGDLAASYYDGAESEATAHILDKGRKMMLSYSHHVRPGFSVASQFKYDKEADDATLVFGGAARLDGATVVKAKVDSRGQAACSYIQDIRARTTLVLSAKFDIAKMDGANVGLSLAMD